MAEPSLSISETVVGMIPHTDLRKIVDGLVTSFEDSKSDLSKRWGAVAKNSHDLVVDNIVDGEIPDALVKYGVSQATTDKVLQDETITPAETIRMLADVGHSNFGSVRVNAADLAKAREITSKFGISNDRSVIDGIAHFEKGLAPIAALVTDPEKRGAFIEKINGLTKSLGIALSDELKVIPDTSPRR